MNDPVFNKKLFSTYGFELKLNNIRVVKPESHGGVGFVIVYEASRVLLRFDASH